MSGKREPSADVNPGGGPAQPRGPGPVDRELPPDLKPFEAALASLSPSADRLQYDLIMFRAGQRAAAGAARRAARAWSLVMPAALLATSAAAATLLVMLLTRPVIERVQVVRVPAAEPSVTGTEQPDGERPSHVVQDASPLPGRYEQGPRPRWPSQTSNVRHSDRLSHPRLGPLRSRTVSLEVLDRMLQQDVDPWARQVAVPAEAVPPPKAPVPYLQQLRDILDNQARAKAPGGRSNVLLTRGAES